MDSNTLRQLVWQPEESAKLDFKIELYKIYEPKPTVQSDIQKWAEARELQWGELIKDILALANGNVGTAEQTGYLIIGADDKLKSDGTPTLRDVGNIVLTRKEILEKVNSYCYPPLSEIQCEVILVDSVKLFAISIPPNPYLYRLSKQLKTPKKEYSPHTVLIRRGDGERIYEASPDEQRIIEQEKQTTFLNSSPEEAARCFEQELANIDAQVSQLILKAPHWRVNLHPLAYNPQLIFSRSDCSEIVKGAMVRLSAAQWRYPRQGDGDESHNFKKGSNWIGVETPSDFFRHEHWRLYQSGQFINFSKMWEENPNYIITDDEIIYTLTSVFRFAANLCQDKIYKGGIKVIIELNNVKGFGLKTGSDLNDLPSQYRKVTENSYKKYWVMQTPRLSATLFEERAFEAIIWFIESFWPDPLIPIEAFKRKQRELLRG